MDAKPSNEIALISSVARKVHCVVQQIAVALVTPEELKLLGPRFKRAFPVGKVPHLAELLNAIEEAERELFKASSSP